MHKKVDGRGRTRVVVTGMGAVTPLGNSVEASWQAALSGQSGVAQISHFDASPLPCQIAGEVTGFNAKAFISGREARRMSRSSHFAIAALRKAQIDAGLPETCTDPERTGVVMGSAIGGFDISTAALQTYWKHGWTRVHPFAVSATLPNMVSHHVSWAANSLGPIATQVSACSAGVQAIGEAAELIRRGVADMMFAGGAESAVTEGIVAGFCAMRALPVNYNDNPSAASRPFDANREGFILSEGSAVLVLESLEHALARGANIIAEYLGYASSSDAYHMIKPDPTSQGAIRAMKWALDQADIDSAEVNYINAHGTSTPLNDSGETFAVKEVFGEQAYSIPISSTKSIMGHAMGAAGAIESMFTIKALQTGILPPTWNYETPDPACDLDYVPNAPRKSDPTVGMCNAFGLGGQNASILFRRWDEA
ncbi:MAG: beta-ketoacyl-ACP synthase II [Candidatus Promineifilaceae bacterium]